MGGKLCGDEGDDFLELGCVSVFMACRSGSCVPRLEDRWLRVEVVRGCVLGFGFLPV